jgi:hypothetical protein
MKEKILEIMKRWGENEWHDLQSGHELYKPTLYTKSLKDDGYELPEEFVLPLCKTHKSDGSWKGSITSPDGKILATVQGVENLELVKALAELFDVKYQFYFGRGTQARAIVNALHNFVATSK